MEIKRIKKLTLMLGTMLFAWMLICIPVHAEELKDVSENMVLETSEKTEMHEKASDTSKVIATLDAQTAVIITEEEQNGWCGITVNDKKGYVKINQLNPLGDTAALNSEFEQLANDDSLLMTEIETEKLQKKQSLIWGTIIVILVIAIFAVGIISAVKNNSQNTEDKKEKEAKEG